MTEKLERAAGTLLTVNARSDFDLEPVCALMKEAHDHILDLEREITTMSILSNARMMKKIAEHGLDFDTDINEKTLICTTTTSCDGEELHQQEMDMSKLYEVFEKRMLRKLQSLGVRIKL